jgi:hypothetical protein
MERGTYWFRQSTIASERGVQRRGAPRCSHKKLTFSLQNDDMKKLKVESFGPIRKAEMDFGDLTLLVGPQASGKSLFLQLFKLVSDEYHIKEVFRQYGYVWSKDADGILDHFFGMGMSGIWRDDTMVLADGRMVNRDFAVSKRGKSSSSVQERVFYIPAQRILGIPEGRPKNFMEFEASTPFVLRYFSETVRRLLQGMPDADNEVFPATNRLKPLLKGAFSKSVFNSGSIVMSEQEGVRRLWMKIQGARVPFMTWSAGQREFMPLLFGFYLLCPAGGVSRRAHVTHVVIEEPEMGLHPMAIRSVIVQIVELLTRGYKVLLSTHHPMILEFCWAFVNLQQGKATVDSLLELLSIPRNAGNRRVFDGILGKKRVKSYFFDRTSEGVVTRDISSLDAFSEDPGVSEWGGIGSFSSHANEVVAKHVGG